MNRCADDCGWIGGHIMHLTVGEHNHTGQPIPRGIRNAIDQRVEQKCSLTPRVFEQRVLAGSDDPDIEVAFALQPLRKRSQRALGDLASIANILALRLINDNSGDIRELLAFFADQSGLGEREQQHPTRKRTPPGACSTAPHAVGDERCRRERQRRDRPPRELRRKNDIGDAAQHDRLLTKAFEDCRYVYLIGLVVTGQRIHHQIDSETECHFALPLAAGDDRRKRAALVINRPGRRPVIAANDNRRNPIIDTAGVPLDPNPAAGPSAGKLTHQVESPRQDMVVGHNCQRWKIQKL